MKKQYKIELQDLIDNDSKRGEVLYEDDNFIRSQYEEKIVLNDLEISLIRKIDHIKKKSISFFTIQIQSNVDCILSVLLKPESILTINTGDHFASMDRMSKYFALIPVSPRHIKFERYGRICLIEELPMNLSIDSSYRALSFNIQAMKTYEIIIIKGPEELWPDIVTCLADSITDQAFTVTGSQTIITKLITELWDYYFNQKIYEPRYFMHGKCESQQVARSLYEIARVYKKVTGLEIYSALMDEIAFCSLLSLPDDGRWRHGEWMNDETHTRLQVDGAHLMLSHYEFTGNRIFLDKAVLATGYLISIAENLNEGIWFLHDSLELSEKDADSHYSLIKTTAFGKSPSNTLALNTHLTTLVLLIRISKLNPGNREFQKFIDEGSLALKTILYAGPLQLGYKGIMTLFNKYYLEPRYDNYHRIARGITIRLLRYAKHYFPRIVMPGGYIDRDLSLKSIAADYHISNLWDLLSLYYFIREDWLLKFIKEGVKYTFQTNFFENMLGKKHRFMPILYDVLCLAQQINMDIDGINLERFKERIIEADILPSHIRFGFDPLYPIEIADKHL